MSVQFRYALNWMQWNESTFRFKDSLMHLCSFHFLNIICTQKLYISSCLWLLHVLCDCAFWETVFSVSWFTRCWKVAFFFFFPVVVQVATWHWLHIFCCSGWCYGYYSHKNECRKAFQWSNADFMPWEYLIDGPTVTLMNEVPKACGIFQPSDLLCF